MAGITIEVNGKIQKYVCFQCDLSFRYPDTMQEPYYVLHFFGLDTEKGNRIEDVIIHVKDKTKVNSLYANLKVNRNAVYVALCEHLNVTESVIPDDMDDEVLNG